SSEIPLTTIEEVAKSIGWNPLGENNASE
ncbi:MAG: hypothetical protein QG670_2660, partial [Thermoproteota archaeon]|nr:hypothetical protein [Thermoproteota archaeon]